MSNDCWLCKNNFDFRMPPAVVKAATDRSLVVFAGAGISTEAAGIFPSTLYDEVLSALSQPPEDDSFPSVMSAYESEFGRLALVQEIVNRIQYAETFPAVGIHASRFHDELATVSTITDVVTTNWDSFFEKKTGALPIVVDGDFAFHSLAGRKVYKLHGSLGNISTLVATKQDYERVTQQLRGNAVGGALRQMLATRIVVFVGYSLRDADFRELYQTLLQSMGNLRPPAYFVSPYESPEANEFGLRIIKTDGTHFVRSLKAHLVDNNVLLSDAGINRIDRIIDLIAEVHPGTAAMDWRGHPPLVFSLAYQDGLRHAVGRVSAQWHTGEYTDVAHVERMLHSYMHLFHRALNRKRYWDAAYIHGYLNVLILLLAEEEDAGDSIPLYEWFPHDMYGDFMVERAPGDPERVLEGGGEGTSDKLGDPQETKKLKREHKQVLAVDELLEFLDGVDEELPDMIIEGRVIVQHMGEGMVPDHTPFLSGVMDGRSRPRL